MKLFFQNSVMARNFKIVVLTCFLGSSYSSPQPPQSSSGSQKLVFLGGSCNPTTWRKDVAIPKLDQLEISYYNPQVDNWSPDLVQIEAEAKDSARVLLFVLDDQTRNIVSMIEVAQLSAARPDSLEVVADSYRRGQMVAGEVLTERTSGLKYYRSSLAQYTADLVPRELEEIRRSKVVVLIVPRNQRGLGIMILAARLVGQRANLEGVPGETLTDRGRPYLIDMARKAGVPVYSNPADALNKALEMVRNSRR